MRTLSKDTLELAGFSSVLERIYVMDERKFGHYRKDESWQGLGQCVYLAHAHFKPHGSTGLHQHQDVDIITLVTQGSITHKGTLGDKTDISEGEVLVQRSGEKGFRHNEINPNDSISSIIQIWMQPENHVVENQAPAAAAFEIIGLNSAITSIYQGASTQVDIIQLKPNQSYEFKQPFLAFLYQGIIKSETQQLYEATAFRADSAQILAAEQGAKIVVFY